MSSAKTQPLPPRLHVILARDKNVGVVFRRGPGKRFALYSWNCDKDQVRIGQWMKNRTYPLRADLSPDGKHLIYFALAGRTRDGLRDSWTAVSRTPYFKALDFYPKGDCWEGGGLFLSNTEYWLNDRYFSEKPESFQNSGLNREKTAPVNRDFGAEDAAIYYTRLLRDGWNMISLFQGEKHHTKSVFERKLGKGWVLRKIAHGQVGAPEGKSPFWEEHELSHQSGAVEKYEAWEWADLNSKSIVWAEKGCLYRASISKAAGVGDRKLIYDFSENSFERIQAPY